jgi:LacI family transcriptional regulator
VAVLIESSRAYGRGVIEGVARYSRSHGNWVLYFEPRGLEAPPPWFQDWHGDGIIARLPQHDMARAVAAKGLPVVELLSTSCESGAPMVGDDNDLIARLALEHFWERGFRHFAYCGPTPAINQFLALRGEAFQRQAEAAGSSCALFSLHSTYWAVADWEREEEEIAAWLPGLPKPVGILACYDERGYQVLNACRRAGVRVPEEVAVLGVSNDTVLCEMSNPPLSSIDLDSRRVGYLAAACLNRMMRGGRAPRTPIRLAPRGVVARRSTDVLATGDSDLAEVLAFIRAHACEGIGVRDVLRNVAVSQRVLERKFRSFLGRTPKAELLRVQMARARDLLADSELPLKEVAWRCGFRGEKYFSDAFHRQCGIRPGGYRRKRRLQSG